MSGEVLHCNDSKSLWNYTLSPGWTEKEVEVFRLALMKFGMGKWTQIVKSRCLPGKTVAQLNNQMQRMIGQQSTGEFVSLHVDPRDVFAYNENRKGTRKNGCLINTGDNPTREEVKKKRERNKAKWGLKKEDITKIVIPTLAAKDTSTLAVKSSAKDGSNLKQAKYDKIRLLEAEARKIVEAMENLDKGNKPKADTKTQKKSKTAKANKSKKDDDVPLKPTRAKRKTQEEKDHELALKLQQELGGGSEMDIDEDDFEEPKPKRRGRKKGKK